ncbi:MAG: dTDP-4-dehydrorhamnose 3,5-epimerase [Flavobacteriaceae bacterium]|nr:MAG: dTDP-4-dehydrorhamnose 3,5-epimerase [Flavobacteriaceae bacterium]
MQFTKTNIPNLIICEPAVFGDHRGYFMETFKQGDLNAFLGLEIDFIQDNESRSSYGVLRGMHYQKGEDAQSKLVRVVEGKVLDVVVDLRKESPTFQEVFSIELSAENKKQLFVPKGCAHGYLVLSDAAIFQYKVDAPYKPERECSFLYKDKTLRIDWGIPSSEIITSEKDEKALPFKDAVLFSTTANLYV